jgi:hypothetical protein
MRLRESKRGSLAFSAAVLAGCAVFIGVTPAVASTPQAASNREKKCIQIHLFENTAAFYRANAETGVGAIGNYLDRLYDSGSFSNQIGTGVGTYDVVFQRPSDGHLFEFSTENDVLPDGSFVISDYFDRTAMLANEWVGGLNGAGMSVKGTGGLYRGMTGTVKWRVLSFTQPGIPTELEYVLCGRSDR